MSIKKLALVLCVVILGAAFLWHSSKQRYQRKQDVDRFTAEFESDFRPIAAVPDYLKNHVPDVNTVNNVTDYPDKIRKMQNEYSSTQISLAASTLCRQAADLGGSMRARIKDVMSTEAANTEAVKAGKPTVAIGPDPFKSDIPVWQDKIQKIEAQVQVLQ